MFWRNHRNLTFVAYLIEKIGTLENAKDLKVEMESNRNLQVCVKDVPKRKVIWNTLYKTHWSHCSRALMRDQLLLRKQTVHLSRIPIGPGFTLNLIPAIES